MPEETLQTATDTNAFADQSLLNGEAVVDASAAEKDIEQNKTAVQEMVTKQDNYISALQSQSTSPTEDKAIAEVQTAALESLSVQDKALYDQNKEELAYVQSRKKSVESLIEKGFDAAPEVKKLQREYERAEKELMRDNEEVLSATQNALYSKGSYRYQSESATVLYTNEVKAGEQRLDDLETKYDELIAEVKSTLKEEAYDKLDALRKDAKDVQTQMRTALKDQYELIRQTVNDRVDNKQKNLAMRKTELDIFSTVANNYVKGLMTSGSPVTYEELSSISKENGIPMEVLLAELETESQKQQEFQAKMASYNSLIASRDASTKLSNAEYKDKYGQGSVDAIDARLALSNAGFDLAEVDDDTIKGIYKKVVPEVMASGFGDEEDILEWTKASLKESVRKDTAGNLTREELMKKYGYGEISPIVKSGKFDELMAKRDKTELINTLEDEINKLTMSQIRNSTYFTSVGNAAVESNLNRVINEKAQPYIKAIGAE